MNVSAVLLCLAPTVLCLPARAQGGKPQSEDAQHPDEGGRAHQKKTLLSEAQEGDVHAQRRLAYRYYTGGSPADLFEPDFNEAAKWFKLAASQGDAQAQFHLSMMYYEGRGLATNYSEAGSLLRLSADQGYAPAQAQLGGRLGGAKGIALLRLSAEQGNSLGARWLGESYESGLRVPLSFKEALKWYRVAAETRDRDGYLAMTRLGEMYLAGEQVPRDVEQGISLLNSATSADVSAIATLARLYETGEYTHFVFSPEGIKRYDAQGLVPVDYGKALRYYERASYYGHETSAKKAGDLYMKGARRESPQLVGRASYGRAIKEYRVAAILGNLEAQIKLGEMYRDGLGVPQDYIQAYVWFNVAGSERPRNALLSLMTTEQVARGQRVSRQLDEMVDWLGIQERLDRLKSSYTFVIKERRAFIEDQNRRTREVFDQLLGGLPDGEDKKSARSTSLDLAAGTSV